MPQYTYSRFAVVAMSEIEERTALQTNPLFLCYLQNKLSAYAQQLVDFELDIDPNPANQMKTMMEIQRLKAFVAAYDELLAELQDAQNPEHSTPQA